MPFFDFKCEKCNHEFNLRISNEEKSKVKCPECGHPKVKQLLSPFFTAGAKPASPVSSGMPPGCVGCGQAGSG